jgi:hypothetical protein
MQRMWNLICLVLLLPVWWPLSLVFLAFILSSTYAGDNTRLHLWTHAKYSALLALGYRDVK